MVFFSTINFHYKNDINLGLFHVQMDIGYTVMDKSCFTSLLVILLINLKNNSCPWLYSVFLGNFHLSLNIYQKKSQKLRENARNLKVFGGRLYRWIADSNRPINRPFFHRLFGRLIGIGRTLMISIHNVYLNLIILLDLTENC